ncbi:SH3 type 3 domain protein [Halothece sp. PCC 7418]|uniref:SH3 domain-containing protein n=1 Tax=Halothece sp. (strain PCC 7418) TaxID=65093 RepID=UPI0002A06BC7|nr:SH3 domain-containing protein [Halothece sp. PCC 7418]AFZ43113.1 SH3 type 3 domain protein [Halothece sp. PCC 7418]
MSISGFVQFILGFLLGIFILTGTGAAAAYFFLNRLSDAPPEPVYSEEKTSEPNNKEESSASNSQQAATTTTKPEPKPEPQEEEKEEEETIAERFGEQAYEARVTWPSGLSLRANPNLSASRVGGVYYDDKLVIIETSSDGDWQKVYVPESGQQAWVKAGNVEKINN